MKNIMKILAILSLFSSTAYASYVIPDGAVTTAKIANGAVTHAKLAALSYSASSSSGTFTMSGSSPVDVTNLSATITTTGRPVVLMLISDGTSNVAGFGSIFSGSGTGYGAGVQFLRGASVIGWQEFIWNGASVSNPGARLPASIFSALDAGASAGSTTYSVKMTCGVASGSCYANYVVLVAYEL